MGRKAISLIDLRAVSASYVTSHTAILVKIILMGGIVSSSVFNQLNEAFIKFWKNINTNSTLFTPINLSL